jgi:hypothetical protein
MGLKVKNSGICVCFSLNQQLGKVKEVDLLSLSVTKAG